MFKPVEMVKISVVGPRDQLEAVAETLHEMNLVHVEDPVEEEYFKLGEPLEKASEVSKGLVQLRSFLSYLQLNPETYDPKRKYKVEELAKQVKEKLEEYNELIGAKIDEIRSLSDKKRALEEELAAIEPLKELGIPPRLLKDYKTVKCFVGIVKADPTHRLKEVTDLFEIIIKDRKKEYIMAVIVKIDYADEFFRILQEFGFREIPIPDIEDYDTRIKEIELEIEQIENRKSLLESEIEEIKVKEAELMMALEEYLSVELEKSELPLKTLVSKYAFILMGYIPAEEYERARSQIEKATQGKVVVEKLEDKDTEPPTLLDNPGPAKDFELFTTLFAIPKYKEFDPTPIVTVFFPVFFGLMLGDIGYGLLITAIALYLKRVFKTEGWQKLLNIALYSGILAIIFGFIYGEFFGPYTVPGYKPTDVHFVGGILYNLYAFNHHHPLFDRVEEMGVKVLLFTSLVIGMFKILWGFAIGFRNVYVEHGLKAAILEKASWFIGVAGMACLVLGFSYNIQVFYKLGIGPNPGNVPPLPLPGLIPGWEAGVNPFYQIAIPLIVIWFILFLMEEIPKVGPMGVVMAVEIVTWFGQILSYARLLAIGLSSVYIAFVINYVVPKLMHTFIPAEIAAAIVAAIVMILAHIVNLLLGILDPGLQALRLHYVEFFTKFFEGGGRLYMPFGRKKKFIE